MITAVVGGLIVWLIFNYVVKDDDIIVDGYLAFAVIMAPAICVFLISLGVSFLNLPQFLVLASLVLYFLIPMLVFVKGFDIETSLAAKYSGIVFGVVVIVDILRAVLVNMVAI